MKKIIFAIIIGILLIAPLRSFAAEEKFFEYATDVGTPVAVPSGSVAVQEFKIYNDYINAVDVWFDNTGSAGSATFSLLDAGSGIIATKIVSIGQSDPFYAGQRLHVKFNKMIGVNSGSWYKLKIVSATPQLRLYATNRVQFVEHNAPYPTDYAVGASLLDGESQFAVYKFALYEEADTEPPVITNASSSIAGTDAVRISFNANELVDRNLIYSPIGSGDVSTIGYSGNYSICFAGVYNCPVTIDTQRDTMYAYRLTARDSWGNESYVDGMFESWKPGTPTPPSESPVTPPSEIPQPATPGTPSAAPLAVTDAKIVSVSKAAVMVSWNTDRAANGVLIVSTDPVGEHIIKTSTDDTQELTHTIGTPDILAANTAYYATVISHAQDGAVAAKVLSFTTLKRSATSTLPIDFGETTRPLSVSVSDDQRSMSVSWSVSSTGREPAGGYRIDVIDARGNLFRSTTVVAGTHTAVLSGLVGGEYHAVVYANDNGVVEKVAAPAAVSVRKSIPSFDTYALIKMPIVYIPAVGFIMLIGGLYWHSRKQKKKVVVQ